MAFTTQGNEVPVIDVHFHYFMPDILGPIKEIVIAHPEEREAAMEKLVRASLPQPLIFFTYTGSELEIADCYLLADYLEQVQHAVAG